VAREPWWERYKVDLPDGEVVDGETRWTLRRETLTAMELGLFGGVSIQEYMMGRDVWPGTYTFLRENGSIWMSDTPAEIRDHLGAIHAIEAGAKSVLITGLGLGMICRAALLAPAVETVTVVELSDVVLRLVAPAMEKLAAEHGKQLEIVQADALRWKPKGGWWDVVWHDIWPTISADNLPEMATLNRRFAKRAGWQGCWMQEGCRWQRDQDRRSGWL